MDDKSSYPHVTAILKEAGLINVEWATEEDRNVGTATHLACQYLDEDGTAPTDLGDLADRVAPRLEAYQRFLADSKAQVLAVEMEVFHEGLRYQGRLDRIVEINGKVGVLDIKGPSQDISHGPQLAAYMECVRKSHEVTHRWNLYLHADATYRLVPRTGRNDWVVFTSALNLHNFKRGMAA